MKIKLTENDLKQIVAESVNKVLRVSQYKYLINESQESKSIDQAKKLLVSKGYTPEQADKFIRIDLRNDLPSLRDSKNAKFILGVTRMFLNKELKDATTTLNLDKTIKLISTAHYNEYDRNLNGVSAEELINTFADVMSSQNAEKRNKLQSMNFQNRGYDIVKINSFEEASKYSSYTSWCVTHGEDAFNSYTANGEAQFYFCLKKGFEEVKPIKGNGCPLDEYGLSMIAVCVDGMGDLKTCTCRWNHDNGGNDSIMGEKQISEVIGVNFYDVFNPSNVLKEKIDALKTMTEIPNGYFSDNKIKGIVIPDNITSIGVSAFKDCASLTSVTIPDSVTKIGSGAFEECTSLTSITIPDSVTSIGHETFRGCTSLTSITIPDSVTSIGHETFEECTSLEAFYGKFASADNRCLIIDGVLNSFAPAGLTEYTIPDSVTKIGSGAFLGCTSLTSITIPDSVTSIGNRALEECTSLTSVTIPESVTSIGNYAFEECTSLTSVNIPYRFKKIIERIFNGINANIKFYGSQNESKGIKKNKIRITESDLKRVIAESVKKVLNERNN